MIYRQGDRHSIAKLRCISVSEYIYRDGRGGETLITRYGFQQEGTGIKFKYSGRRYRIDKGGLYDIRGTIKREADGFGYIQLARIELITITQGSLAI